ncbi:precorrin-6y C5,15-methyltransferase (decarboxylating) subunit CbiE [Marmoricola sp. RAF53]|uniref:precorrin-6y C5,15-methyltransferase (decarboxylating) subunit CbiE n=1 Tax=Marmoricola sp. RAF53 TaxID=3233059 RepID=UPI003F9B862E
MEPFVTVHGIAADGWDALNPLAQQGILAADVLVGGARHLAMVPPVDGQLRVGWQRPLRDHLLDLLAEHAGQDVVVLASGDPLVSGVGSILAERLGADRVRIEPAISSVALARARMAWPAETVEVLTLVGRDEYAVLRALAPGHRLLVLCSDGGTTASIAALLAEHGFGASRLTALGDLGTAAESRRTETAAAWSGDTPALTVLAVECVGTGWGWAPGLPDAAYEHDGQLTKRDARASALARLAPGPGQLLWDVGAGAGSIGIEWLRTHPTTAAVAVEADGDRADRIARNARALGVPRLRVVEGRAPDALAGLPAPDAVFVGGGATRPGVLDACLAALRTGGRVVVHGVTLETSTLLATRYAALGGELTRIQTETAAPVGGFTGWTPARAITQWAWTKPASEEHS